MSMHGTARGIPHVLIEVRNDLIADENGQERWADLLSQEIRAAVVAMKEGGHDQPAAENPMAMEARR